MPSTVLQRGSAALMSADALDGLDRGADVVAVAGADREDQRIEDDVLGLDAVAVRSAILNERSRDR